MCVLPRKSDLLEKDERLSDEAGVPAGMWAAGFFSGLAEMVAPIIPPF